MPEVKNTINKLISLQPRARTKSAAVCLQTRDTREVARHRRVTIRQYHMNERRRHRGRSEQWV